MSKPTANELVDARRPAASSVNARVERRRLRRLVLGSAAMLAVLAAWEGLTWLIAYTDDAYVRSDLVAISPQVDGIIVAVLIADNREVRRGDLLAVIDKVPFQLALDERQAAIREADATAAADRDGIAVARDRLDVAAATLQYANEEQRRVAALIADGTVSRQQFDQADEVLRRARAEQAEASTSVDKASQSLALHEAAAARSQAALALAEWQLGKTEIRAPVDGTINNLTVQVGDAARAGTPLIGIIDAAAWRIVANYKQSYIRRMYPGQTAWVWLDTHPWRFYRARIQGIARGISREQTPAELLPYVAPTTDWIRLRHRFPVTLTLVDPPPDLTLYMGADARTLIFR